MSVSDNFDRADAGLGANWTTAQGVDPVVVSNAASATAGSYSTYCSAFWSAVSFNAAHSSAVTKSDANNYNAVAVRMNASSGGNWIAYFNHGEAQKCVNGTVTSGLATLNTCTSGDTMKIDAPGSGTTYTCTRNSDTPQTFSDASLSGGSPGIAFYFITGPLVDNWIGTGEVAPFLVSRGLFVRRAVPRASFY